MSALLEITLGYSVKLSERARALLTEASIVALEFDKDGTLPPWGPRQPIISVDALAKLRALLDEGAEVQVKRVVSNSSTAALMSFGQRNTTIENTRCNVAVAGLGLLTVDMVQVETDCCTHHLQELLTDGWRILAVCVQPDQRRPDYVLGRTNLDGRTDHRVEPDRPWPMPAPERPIESEPAPAPDPVVASEREVFRAVHRGGLEEPAQKPARPLITSVKDVLEAVGQNAALHASALHAIDDGEDIPF